MDVYGCLWCKSSQVYPKYIQLPIFDASVVDHSPGGKHILAALAKRKTHGGARWSGVLLTEDVSGIYSYTYWTCSNDRLDSLYRFYNVVYICIYIYIPIGSMYGIYIC
jgi:hypothetical protein